MCEVTKFFLGRCKNYFVKWEIFFGRGGAKIIVASGKIILGGAKRCKNNFGKWENYFGRCKNDFGRWKNYFGRWEEGSVCLSRFFLIFGRCKNNLLYCLFSDSVSKRAILKHILRRGLRGKEGG